MVLYGPLNFTVDMYGGALRYLSRPCVLCVYVVTGGSTINNAGTLCVGSRHDGILRRYPTGRQGNRLRRQDQRLDGMLVVSRRMLIA